MDTVPIVPVFSPYANKPPVFLNSFFALKWVPLKILRAFFCFKSPFIKFAKYGRPVFTVTSNNNFALSLFQSNFLVIAYVGIGKENIFPSASPSKMTSRKARLMIAISSWQSPYVKSCSSPPTIAGRFARSSGAVQSKHIFANGEIVPQRDGVFKP